MACSLEKSTEQSPNLANGGEEELLLPDRFPPEPQSGSMEYKLHLIDPTPARLEHLTTQMKWRMEEGGGEATYRLGVADNGEIPGLDSQAIEKSLHTLYKMAEKIGASVSVLEKYRCRVRKRQQGRGEGGRGSEEGRYDGGGEGGRGSEERGKGERGRSEGDGPEERMVIEVLVREGGSSQCAHYLQPCVAVLGPVEAGKSTLLGVLTDGQLDNGRGQARLNLLRHRHELLSGHTSSISHGFLGFNKEGGVVNYTNCGSIQEICEASSKLVTFIDLAGHKKYLKTTVFGLTAYQPEMAMLVVGTDTKIDETTCDQVCFSLALHMPIFVVVTKVDKYSKQQLQQTTQAIVKDLLQGKQKEPLLVESQKDVCTAAEIFREGRVAPIFHISCVTGHNIPLLQNFLHLVPVEITQQRQESLSLEPTEFHVDELFNVEGVGLVLGGILKRGMMREGQELLIGPLMDGSFNHTTVCSIRFRINRAPCTQIQAGQAVTLTVSNTEKSFVRKGTVLVSQVTLNSSAYSCFEFEMDLTLLHSSNSCVKRGFQATIYVASIMQNAVISSIENRDSLSTGEQGRVRCRFLHHPEFLRIGSHVVLREGPTKATGVVVHLFPLTSFPHKRAP